MHISKPHNLVRENINFDGFFFFGDEFFPYYQKALGSKQGCYLVDYTFHALSFIGFPAIFFFFTFAQKLTYLKYRRVFQVNGWLYFASE